MRLRSADLRLPDAAGAAAFLESVWGLVPAGKLGAARYFRGTGDHPYIFSLTESPSRAMGAVTFAGSPREVAEAEARARAGKHRVRSASAFDVPGGGGGFDVEGPEGHVYRLVAEEAKPAALAGPDQPVQITHVVLNCRDVAALERFSVNVLGFRVSDRTRMMTFVRCNRKHHALAYAHADASTLNHVAFEMPGIDAAMRGLSRMREAGFDTVWGPGRHGPGNNVFNYFVAPFGAVIEYTAEVSEVGDDYKVGGPEDWKWPPGRIDHWGVSKKDVASISAAERAWPFLPFDRI
jgi:catechol 2,3-dioxygenase-like lactoylglutathione lyase family enzyme